MQSGRDRLVHSTNGLPIRRQQDSAERFRRGVRPLVSALQPYLAGVQPPSEAMPISCTDLIGDSIETQFNSRHIYCSYYSILRNSNEMTAMKPFLTLMFCLLSTLVWADRIKDLSSVQGVRSNQLVGYGLVVGLDGTGDKSPFTNQTFRNMMEQFGLRYAAPALAGAAPTRRSTAWAQPQRTSSSCKYVTCHSPRHL